jgi:hypothetical protein
VRRADFLRAARLKALAVPAGAAHSG